LADEVSFVTIKVFVHPNDCIIAKAKLESEGIQCFVLNEITIQVDPLLSNAVGGAKLQVHEADAKRALEILEQESEPEIEDEYKEMFKDDAEEIAYQAEQKMSEEDMKRKMKWGCILTITVFILLICFYIISTS